MSFANLKRNSGDLERLSKAIETINEKSGGDSQENFWRPETDKAGNGQAVIRFLPAPEADGEDALPWVKIFSHGFQGPQGAWLIDNCLTTNGKQCPVCEHNSTLWNTGIEANKEIVRKQKRKLNYISNVLIVSDPKHPENEGKVKLFKYGKKIFDKITEAMNPQFEDEVAFNPFNMWNGANFKLKIRKVDGFANYDKSEFEKPSQIDKNDDVMEKLWKSEMSLSVLIADKEFKSYEELEKRLQKTLGLSGNAPRTTVEQTKASAPKAKHVAEASGAEPGAEDDMDYFAKLAQDDDIPY